jgi:hypothetical protein
MPIETNISNSPYHSRHDAEKNFYMHLFKPGVSLQVAEMNDLQVQFQEQLERLGNNLFKRGTILDGCNFTFYENYPYIKIMDAQIDGAPAIAEAYVGNFIRNSANLVAYVIDSEDGFESTDPDLKTLYLKYINSSTTGNATKFAAGQALTIYDANNGVQKVTINNGGTQFSNSDTIVFMPAMAVNVTSGSFTAGDIVVQTNDTYTAYAEIIEVNTTIDTTKTILKLKPRSSDLVNASINSLSWTFLPNNSIANSTTIADIDEIYGSGAEAEIITNGSGKITTITVTNGGGDYDVDPHTTVKSKLTRASLGSLSLTAQTYICQVRVASVVNAVGNGYAFGVSEGVIYQKGFAVRVEPQTVVVDKYSNQPNNLCVAFQTNEEIIDSNIDTSLLDNVLGTENGNAPGADRLKLIPELVVLTTDEITANDDIFPICEWSEGQPYKQNQRTQYDVIGDAMAEQANDIAGDFVKDRFLVTTRSPVNTSFEANTFSIVIDPGTAYIKGQKVETLANFVLDVDKGIDTATRSNTYVSLNYGNYIKIKEVAGVFQFDTADQVSLYGSARQYLTTTAQFEGGAITPTGTLLGTARIRNMVLDEGVPGTPAATYRLYLFDVNMNSGKNFANVRSIYYNGAGFKGIADVVLNANSVLNANIAQLNDIKNDRMLFYCGHDAPKNANQITYQYRTLDQNAQMTNNGNVVITLAATEEFFPYTSALSDSQEGDIYVIPTGATLYGSAKLTGTVSTTSGQANLVGTSTTFFADLEPGDYVKVSANSTGGFDVRRVERVVNNTLAILNSSVSFTNASANVYMAFPRYVPIPVNSRTGYTANVDVSGKELKIYLDTPIDAAGNSNVAVAFNVERRDAAQTTKTVKRDVFVKIRCNTHSDGVSGPWCLGVPDIIRLKKVYTATDLNVNVNSSDITSKFFIDHNQNPNYYGLGYLYKDPYADLTLSADAVLLAQFDCLETTGSGFYTVASYVATDAATLFTNDSTALASATNIINSFEIPEMYDAQGKRYDLIRYFDFRPKVSNTANLSITSAAATTNPAETISFGNTADPTNNKKFPVPDSILNANVEIWLGRVDSVFVNQEGKVYTLRGNYSNQRSNKIFPRDSMLLNSVVIPPYPGLPKYLSSKMKTILDKNIANERFSNQRIKDKLIQIDVSEDELAKFQPVGYTMSDIGKLERRIEDLEYYNALTLLEASMKEKAIPSSLADNINRFKYGFFIDDFRTLNYSDIDSPEYAADNEDDRIFPDTEVISVYGDEVETPDYTEVLILSQKNATSANGGGGGNTTPGNTTLVSVYAKQEKKHKKGKDRDPIKEPPVTVTMSSIAATATLWLHMMDGADQVFIYQGNTLILTGDDAVKITNAEKAELLKDDFFRTNSGGPGGINDVLTNGPDSGPVGNNAVKQAGKIVIPHNPSAGRTYTVQIYKQSKVWRFRLDYPVDEGTAQPPRVPGPKKKKPKYNGHIKDWKKIRPKKLKKIIGKLEKKGIKGNIDKKGKNNQVEDIVIKKLGELIGQQTIDLDVGGLKPFTDHKLFAKGVDDTANCRQRNTVAGVLPAKGTLKSDARGMIDLEYSITPAAAAKLAKNNYDTDEEEMAALQISIINSDGSSKAIIEALVEKNKEDDLIEAVKKNKKK